MLDYQQQIRRNQTIARNSKLRPYLHLVIHGLFYLAVATGLILDTYASVAANNQNAVALATTVKYFVIATLIAAGIPYIALRSGIPLLPWIKVTTGISLALFPQQFMPDYFPATTVAATFTAACLCAFLYLADIWLNRQAHAIT